MLIAAAESIDPSAPLVVISIIAVVASVAVVGAMWVRTKPPRPDIGPPIMQGGDEPPAVVDLLTGGFRVDDDAVPATVVDLAARRWLDIEEVAGGNVIVRVRTGKGELTRYEARVRRQIESRAVDGVAPAAALTLGPEGVSKRWWKGFVREVNRHGRDLGLCRRRWDIRHLAMMWLPIGIAWVIVAATAGTAERVERDGGWGSAETIGVTLCFLTLAGLSYVAKRITGSDAQAPTDLGMEAASRWLGVREYLAGTGSFDRAPAASVAIWERQLAYGTAMGLAPVVQRQLPFEVEHDRHAWSRSTGHWRRVRIRYVSLRPGWGVAPWVAAFSGVIQSVVLGVVVWAGLSLARESFDLASLPSGAQDWLPVVGLVVAAMALVALAWTSTKLASGLLDLFRRRNVEGELVRRREYRTGHRLPKIVQWAMWSGRNDHGHRRDTNRTTRYHLAVDDGSDGSIVAYRVRPEVFRQARQGARVRVRVTPLLGYVTELEEISPPPRAEAAVAHELVEEAAGQMTEAATSMVGRLGDQLAVIEARLGGDSASSVLDQVGDDGRTGRERLAEARDQMGKLRAVGGAGPLGSDGQSLLGGLAADLTAALDRLTGEVEEPQGEPREDPSRGRATGEADDR